MHGKILKGNKHSKSVQIYVPAQEGSDKLVPGKEVEFTVQASSESAGKQPSEAGGLIASTTSTPPANPKPEVKP